MCIFFQSLMPFRRQLVHCRWSGEECWVLLGELATDLPVENATSYPFPERLILYRVRFSETEIVIPYSAVCFASKVGQIVGSHFMTIAGGADQPADLGRLTLWEGAQQLTIEYD